MRVVLEVVSEPNAGRTLLLRPGQVLNVGRTEWSDLAIAHDGYMSSVHFSVKCEDRGCRVCDLDSSNGTFLNGEPIIEAIIADGDEIVAGKTKFAVRILDPPSALEHEPTAEAAGDSAGNAKPAAAESGAAQSPRESVSAAVPPAANGRSSPAPLQPVLSGIVDASRPYAAALQDEDPMVRREALWAAAWTGQKWLLEYCRRISEIPSPDNWEALMLLAILGEAPDLERILAIGRAAELGPRRYQVLGAFGHPGVMKTLLPGIKSQDVTTAVAAGLAFSKMTGADIDSEETVSVPAETTDLETPDTGVPEEAIRPNPRLAMEHWNEVGAEFSGGTRWCRGLNLSGGVTDEVLEQLDMESRWQACLRGKFHGTWQVSPIDLQRFPASKVPD